MSIETPPPSPIEFFIEQNAEWGTVIRVSNGQRGVILCKSSSGQTVWHSRANTRPSNLWSAAQQKQVGRDETLARNAARQLGFKLGTAFSDVLKAAKAVRNARAGKGHPQ